MGPLMMDVAGRQLDAEDRELLAHPLVGGCILFSRNFESRRQLIELVAALRKQRPELLLAVDYEGGRVQRFREEFTRLPPMQRLGQLHDEDAAAACHAAHTMGWLIGSELGAVGLDLCFAPVVDLDGGISSVIGDRAVHAQPDVVTALAAQFCQGLRSAGLKPTAKHFPGHGQVAADSHQALPVDERTLEAILEQDVQPFRQLMASGLESVMMAHILFPAVDERPASLSPVWVQNILRQRLGFAGSIFCDDLSMHGAAAVGGYLQRAEAALGAGCDMLPVCNNRAAVVELLDGLHWRSSHDAQARLRHLRAQPTAVPAAQQRAAQVLMEQLNNAAGCRTTR